jgi:hypothetical protein
MRRALCNANYLEEEESFSMDEEKSLDMELKTDLNYQVITARDAYLLRQSKKAAERALQYSNNGGVLPYNFLEWLLVRFGVFVPIDISIARHLGGRDYSRNSEFIDYQAVALDNAPKVFFLPSLLGPGDPNVSGIWTFKANESWKTTICHSVLFPDGVPPGLMERLIACILKDLYTTSSQSSNSSSFNPNANEAQRDSRGQLWIKEILCWRSLLYLKIGALADKSHHNSIAEIIVTLVGQDSPLCVASDSMCVGMPRLTFSGRGQAGDNGFKIWKRG